MLLTSTLIALSAFLHQAVALATTTVKPYGCSVPTPIVKNGDFENGQAPWVVASVRPPYDEYYSHYESFNVSVPGYQSSYAYTVTDFLATSFFQLDLAQSITLCPGQEYNFAAQFYILDQQITPNETALTFFVDDFTVATTRESNGLVWTPLSGNFTAGGSTATLTASFVAYNIENVRWGIDDVVITPA